MRGEGRKRLVVGGRKREGIEGWEGRERKKIDGRERNSEEREKEKKYEKEGVHDMKSSECMQVILKTFHSFLSLI
jgi:hypothetical protein